MRAADVLLTATADNVANLNTEDRAPWETSFTEQPGGGVSASVSRAPTTGVDLVDEMVALSVSGVIYAANAQAFRVNAQAERSMIDLLA